MSETKIIMHLLDHEQINLASRAARWLLAQPAEQKDAILTYDDSRFKFFVRRNKASITVREFD